MKMKILLITPEVDTIEGYNKDDVKLIGFPSLTAAVLAALTPDFAEFMVIDEAIEPLKTPERFDAIVANVGALSVNMSYKANRAAEIAQELKKRGKIVIWGGVHVTSLYDHHRERFEEEIAPLADAVVLGEAEEVWLKLLEDIRDNCLKKVYRAADLPSSEIWPTPKYSAIKTDSYLVRNSCQATRGCPFDCNFCSVTAIYGKTYRKRDARVVADEIRSILGKSVGQNLSRLEKAKEMFIAFVDDNIGRDKNYFAELLMELIEVKREFPKFSWGGQTTLNTIDVFGYYKGAKHSLADLMRRSGCIAMFVGIESVSKESLATVGKNFNDVEKYPDQIKKWHDCGIMLNAGMIAGFSTDTKRVFEDIYKFLVTTRIEISLLNILVPLPGTKLYHLYASEGRIFDHNWENYDGRHVVYYPELMTPEELENGFFQLWKELYSWPSIIKRVANQSQIVAAVRTLPNFSKAGQIISRVYMNKKYAQISSRIGKARQSASRERFGQNINFAELRAKTK